MYLYILYAFTWLDSSVLFIGALYAIRSSRWLSGKESVCNAGDPGLIPGSGRSPGEGYGYLPQYPCLENSMGRGALWATVLWGHKELDMTEQLTISLSIFYYLNVHGLYIHSSTKEHLGCFPSVLLMSKVSVNIPKQLCALGPYKNFQFSSVNTKDYNSHVMTYEYVYFYTKMKKLSFEVTVPCWISTGSE